MIVRKYGGSSLVTSAQLMHICHHLPSEPIAIVLSAKKGHTDQLYESGKGLPLGLLNQHLALGEYQSCRRLWLMLESMNRKAEIMTYKNIGLISNQLHGGEIIDCQPHAIQMVLSRGKIALIPGFQASYLGQLAILKRGASDDTCVMLAAKMDAKCEMYTDVSYIYSDEKEPLRKVSYDRVSEIVGTGCSPISQGAIKIAREYGIVIHFSHWQAAESGTLIADR